ncbi:hypothetical protein LCGC14_1807560 [marine sediment metagenome]|uniref:Uncharacterized protein n=1 Tax=marine sediment metagenome TaxID=412755 RepID=A0A0F9GML7_9ZZZZ
MKYSKVWEPVTDDKCAGCARLKIHGGWLVIAWVNTRSRRAERLPESLVFVPDPAHAWELEG